MVRTYIMTYIGWRRACPTPHGIPMASGAGWVSAGGRCPRNLDATGPYARGLDSVAPLLSVRVGVRKSTSRSIRLLHNRAKEATTSATYMGIGGAW